METRNLAAPRAPRDTWVGSSTLLTPPLQGMLADGPPAVRPGKTGDVGIGDTITGYLWRFRELDTFGSPGCLVQDGERALLLPGRSQMIPLLTDLLPQKTCLSPCPHQPHIPEGTESVQSPRDATRRAMSSIHTSPQPKQPKPLLPLPVPAQVNELHQDKVVMGHCHMRWLLCQFLSAKEKRELVSSPCRTFLIASR